MRKKISPQNNKENIESQVSSINNPHNRYPNGIIVEEANEARVSVYSDEGKVKVAPEAVDIELNEINDAEIANEFYQNHQDLHDLTQGNIPVNEFVTNK